MQSSGSKWTEHKWCRFSHQIIHTVHICIFGLINKTIAQTNNSRAILNWNVFASSSFFFHTSSGNIRITFEFELNLATFAKQAQTRGMTLYLNYYMMASKKKNIKEKIESNTYGSTVGLYFRTLSSDNILMAVASGVSSLISSLCWRGKSMKIFFLI